jgi:hypothetical protein
VEGVTTVKISKQTASLLNKIKIHPRQAYEEVVSQLISEFKQKSDSHFTLSENREITTIKLSKKTVEELNGLKIHPRQAYEEVILKLISTNERARGKTEE